MKITGPGSIIPPSVRRTGRAAGDGGRGFAAQMPGEETTAAPVLGNAPVAAVDALLALQEVPDATTARKRLMKRGRSLLDRLDEIRHGLLLGGLSRERLTSLARELREQRPNVEDPGLIAVLDEIELRAAVELAKYGH